MEGTGIMYQYNHKDHPPLTFGPISCRVKFTLISAHSRMSFAWHAHGYEATHKYLETSLTMMETICTVTWRWSFVLGRKLLIIFNLRLWGRRFPSSGCLGLWLLRGGCCGWSGWGGSLGVRGWRGEGEGERGEERREGEGRKKETQWSFCWNQNSAQENKVHTLTFSYMSTMNSSRLKNITLHKVTSLPPVSTVTTVILPTSPPLQPRREEIVVWL